MRGLTLILCCIILISLMPLVSEAQGDSSFPITIIDATGREVTIESIDAIASGSGDVTEIIVALGFQSHLVGIDISSTYPPNLDKSIEVIGFARRLTVEPIAAVQPTVFFCTEICTPTIVLDQLRELGIPVVIIPDNPEPGLELPIQKIAMVAAALGVPERGEALIEKLRVEIDWTTTALANVTEEQPYVLMVYVRGIRLQLISGAGVPANTMIEAAGGIDAAADIGVNGYTTLNAELILTSYPDYILLMQGGVESAGGLEAIDDIQGVAQTPAGQNHRYLVFDDMYLLGMSTRTGQMLLELAHSFHPSMTWELQVAYPYTVQDITGTETTIENTRPVVTTTDELFDVVQQLGYHPLRFDAQTPDAGIIITTIAEDWPRLRAAGYSVIVVENADDIAAIAQALGVPGRGDALIARRK